MTGVGRAEDWLRHAESDLALARAAAGLPDVLPEQMAFHAQQAVEKALKALLVDRGVDFPRTHDLQELMDLVSEIGEAVPTGLQEAVGLTPFAVQYRYPGDEDPLGAEEARFAIDLAGRAVAWVRALLARR